MTDDIVVNNEGEAPLDNPEEGTIVQEETTQESTPSTPAAPQIDFAALYRESLAERRAMQERLEAIERQRTTPQEEELTDNDIERLGTVGTINKVVENQLRKHLSEQFGPITEMSREFKRNKQIAEAENAFFQQFPQASGAREALAQVVRQTLSNAPNVDANTYTQAALAAVGLYTFNNMNNQPPAAPTNTSPQRTSAPAPRVNGNPSAPAATGRRLTELERAAIRNYGLDPNKRADVDSFFAIVENDEGVTV
jgi:hypothetical protein